MEILAGSRYVGIGFKISGDSSSSHSLGYGRAALHLGRQWCPDPELMPFAKNVKHRQLVHMLQDGCTFDRLRAMKTNVRLILSLEGSMLTPSGREELRLRQGPRPALLDP